ncbi:hypothetical protein DDW44_06295 [Streptomyces tirandamycinicus]|uniref:Uncharacterized protein n=1 Tax=Streptomyces tirandamycinicus TaxID=2174846 RepID=A0A2S1T2R6_9ACTN|nr:hypothetical protein DDW44_06295 [Streptomyces tirandamycinicus]
MVRRTHPPDGPTEGVHRRERRLAHRLPAALLRRATRQPRSCRSWSLATATRRPGPTISCPVTVTGDGVWDGKPVSWSATHGNACEMSAGMARNSGFTF